MIPNIQLLYYLRGNVFVWLDLAPRGWVNSLFTDNQSRNVRLKLIEYCTSPGEDDRIAESWQSTIGAYVNSHTPAILSRSKSREMTHRTFEISIGCSESESPCCIIIYLGQGWGNSLTVKLCVWCAYDWWRSRSTSPCWSWNKLFLGETNKGEKIGDVQMIMQHPISRRGIWKAWVSQVEVSLVL